MNEKQWNAFCEYKIQLKKLCDECNVHAKELFVLQKQASAEDTPEYPLENAAVYNTAYDSITKDDEIKLIVIGDNPGKDEQREKNRKYLVGQSGKIADGFFKKNPELGVDFRKNVIISNKTPLHTAKTKHLKYLNKNGSEEIQRLIEDSQIRMAEMCAELHQKLVMFADVESFKTQLWLVGYAELKKNGIFEKYRDVLRAAYAKNSDAVWNEVFVYQHFSMNRFLVDSKSFMAENPSLSVKQALVELGHKHRNEIFGGEK